MKYLFMIQPVLRGWLLKGASLIGGLECGMDDGMENGMEQRTYTVITNLSNWRGSV